MHDNADTALIRRIRSAAPDIRLEVSQWQDRAYEAVIEGSWTQPSARSIRPPPCRVRFFSKSILSAWWGPLKEFDPLVLPWPSIYSFPMWWSRPGGRTTPVDRPLAQFGAKRRVVLSVPFFAQQCSQLRKRTWS